ncbi:hypothetical protein IP70_13410 [alpha proteobacterium AAP38]|nr:hypothetical protein IP70_13410 [alpha proteobacterium AAP38]
MVVSSLQAVLFGIDGAELLRAGPAFTCFEAHMRRVAEIGAELSAGVIVFGAPRSRLLNGLDRAEAMERAVERLAGLVPALRAGGLVLGIEPVPQYYGGEFLTCAEQVATLVERIGDPAIRLHLDTGCAYLGGDAIDLMIARFHPLLAHFHAAEPDLAGFAQPLLTHMAAAAALDLTGYDGWISIEMKPQAPDPIQALDQAIGFVRSLYDTG